jgi:hypothetical protein
MKRKTLVAQKYVQVVVQTGHVHTRAVLLVGRIRMHVELPTGHVPVTD